MFGLDTCGNAEEINFARSDKVTSFLHCRYFRFVGGELPCINLHFVVGGESVWGFKFFESRD